MVIHEEDGEIKDKSGDEEEEYATSLLDRMKEVVDEMRRRRSVALRITTTHAKELSPRPLFALVTPNLRCFIFQPELHEVEDTVEDESNEVREQEPFSALRFLLAIVVADPVDGESSPGSRDGQEEQHIRAKATFLRAPKSIEVAARPFGAKRGGKSFPKHSLEFMS